MNKLVKEILKDRENIVNELMAISEDLNGDIMIETNSYYNGGIFEDEDLEEVLDELNLSIIDTNVEVPQTIKEKIKDKLNFL